MIFGFHSRASRCASAIWAGVKYASSIAILALWLASEIAARDLSSPPPKDPYRLDRWRKGEGNPDQ